MRLLDCPTFYKRTKNNAFKGGTYIEEALLNQMSKSQRCSSFDGDQKMSESNCDVNCWKSLSHNGKIIQIVSDLCQCYYQLGTTATVWQFCGDGNKPLLRFNAKKSGISKTSEIEIRKDNSNFKYLFS